MHVSLSVYPMCRGVHRGQRRGSDWLELRLEVAVSRPTWSLGSELRSTGGAGRVPNCQAILLVPQILFCSLFVFLFWDRVSVCSLILATKSQTFCLISQVLWLWIWMYLADRSTFFFQCQGCNPRFYAWEAMLSLRHIPRPLYQLERDNFDIMIKKYCIHRWSIVYSRQQRPTC